MVKNSWLLGICLVACGSQGGGFSNTGQSPGADASFLPTGEAGIFADGGVSGQACGRDLRSVVDSAGRTVGQCSPDEGCLAGRCVPACEAAAGAKGTFGCDFAVSPQPFWKGWGACLAAFVTNSWERPVRIKVSRAGTTFDATKVALVPNGDPDPKRWGPLPPTGLPVGQVAVVFLSGPSPGEQVYPCPIAPAAPASAANDTGRGASFRIETDAPVSTYDIFPFGSAESTLTSAELVYPTTSWGTNYVAYVPPFDQRAEDVAEDSGRGRGRQGPQFLQVMAYEPDTEIRVFPTTSFPGSTSIPAAPSGRATTLKLGAFEYAQWAPVGEASGTVFQSDKPMMLLSGTVGFCLTSKTSPVGGGCESEHKQVAPVSALGHEYVSALPGTRLKSMAPESFRYRLVGASPGTNLVMDPPLATLPAVVGIGQVVDFEAQGSFVVRSQDKDHPFLLVQMAAGGTFEPGSSIGKGTFEGRGGARQVPGHNPSGSVGDEEAVPLLPPEQFLNRYVFFTDPTYGTTNFALVRVNDGSGFHDVSVDCLGTLGGWRPLDAAGRYQVTDVDMSRGGVMVGSCKDGHHVAQSAGSFGLTVWGLDHYVSYAYPAGGNVGTIHSVVIPVPK